MKKWKIAFFLTLLLLVISNGYWFVSFVDAAISYSYLNDSLIFQSDKYGALGSVVVAGSRDYSKADMLHLLRQAKKNAFIVEEERMIVFENVEFVFADDRLIEVR